MDKRGRQITKIAREVQKFTIRAMKAEGVGSGEFDFIHTVRKTPGITQAGVREVLGIDKGAAARRAASLEEKGYLVRRENPEDKRSRLLFATDKADRLKNSKANLEAIFYDWLLETLEPAERETFLATLEKLYYRSKVQSRAGFPDVTDRMQSLVPNDEEA